MCKTWRLGKYRKVEESQGRVVSVPCQQANTGSLITVRGGNWRDEGRWTTLLLYYNARCMSPPVEL